MKLKEKRIEYVKSYVKLNQLIPCLDLKNLDLAALTRRPNVSQRLSSTSSRRDMGLCTTRTKAADFSRRQRLVR